MHTHMAAYVLTLPALPISAAADGAGDDWVGVDGAGKPWVCTTGTAQSPINIVTSAAATAALANEHRVQYELGAVASNGSNIRLANNGHSVQVSWTGAAVTPKLTITVKGEGPCRRRTHCWAPQVCGCGNSSCCSQPAWC